MTTLLKFFPPYKKNQIIFTAFMCMLLLALLQDFLHAHIRDYQFVFTESLLFNSFWLLFIPGFSLIRYLYKFSSGSKTSGNIILLAVLSVISCVVHILIFPLLVKMISALVLDHTYRYGQTISFIMSDRFYVCLLAYISFSSAYYQLYKNNEASEAQKREKEDESSVRVEQYISQLTVKSGNKHLVIEIMDIFYCRYEKPYVALHTLNGKFLIKESLKSLIEKLDPLKFSRIHRSTILNTDKVISFKSRLNGDYDIMLNDNSEVRASRNYNEDFKSKFIKFSF